MVQQKIIPLSARGGVSVHIQKQRHPVVVRAGRQHVAGFGVEVQVLRIPSHLHSHKIVSPCVVGQPRRRVIAGVIACICVAGLVPVLRVYVIPLLKAPVEIDRVGRPREPRRP